jgi:putative membrane protein
MDAPATGPAPSSSPSYGTAAPTDSSAATPSSGTTGSAAATTAGTLQGNDATFLQKAMAGGREEVQNAQAALSSAKRAEVRSVAQMMLEDHQRSNQQLQSLASRKGWSIPSDASAEADQPRSSPGTVSDDAYLQQEIRHHKETISLYRAQAAGGSDPDLRQFARDQLPALEHHLEMLQGSHTRK